MPISLRAETASLIRLADRDLARLWRLIANGAAADEALHDLLPAIITEYGAAGAAMAAEWYDQQREKVGARGAFTALPVAADDRGAHALVGWALAEANDDTSLATLVAGGAQRRIADHARYTVARNSIEDKAARGWQRVGSGDNCSFCNMLIGRGAVYSESTVEFSSHDRCNCEAQPAWGGRPLPVKPYVPSRRNITDADRERVVRWLTGRNGTPGPSSLDDPAWLRHQLGVIEGLKDSPWRTKQLARFADLIAKAEGSSR